MALLREDDAAVETAVPPGLLDEGPVEGLLLVIRQDRLGDDDQLDAGGVLVVVGLEHLCSSLGAWVCHASLKK